MKICISSLGDSLESEVDPRFGRCQYFIIYDVDNDSFESVKNENVIARGGAGIQSAQLVASKGVEVVLTGNVGPNAYQTLEAAGVEVITGVSGKIKEVVDRYKNGEYKSSSSPNVGAKFGIQTHQPMSKSTEKDNEIGNLKEEIKSLREKLDEINKRLNELKRKE